VDRRVRATPERIQKALQGNHRPEHLFVLGQAFSLHAAVEEKIQACDEQIVREAGLLADQVDPQRQLPTRKEGRPARMDLMQGQDMREVLFRKFGTDLTAIESIGVATALGVLTEVGPSLSGFKTEKHFCSWLGLCPNNRISGGKVLSSRTRKVVNRVADALRMLHMQHELGPGLQPVGPSFESGCNHRRGSTLVIYSSAKGRAVSFINVRAV
jgi:transposase